jgi:hypothetical protein
MHRRIIVSVVGALAAASLMAPAADAAGAPASVTVRVEAPARTLADATLTTTRTPVVKDGNAAHSCSGTSAAGALQQVTGGKWTASWFTGLGYAVNAIEDVKPASLNDYWTLWLNGKPSTTGVCDTELQAGDQVLEFICSSTPDFSSCTDLPLALSVKRIGLGSATVAVTLLKGDGTSTPVAGAVVRGGVKPVATGANGSAKVLLRLGQTTLRATHAGDVASGLLHCQHGVHGAKCGSRDQTPPTLAVKGIRDGAIFTAKLAPRLLHGVARDPSGVTVALRLTRRNGTRCASFDATHAAFRACGAKPRPLFQVGDRTQWSYLLPAKLLPGSYGLVARATDGAGNATTVKLRFTVEPRT